MNDVMIDSLLYKKRGVWRGKTKIAIDVLNWHQVNSIGKHVAVLINCALVNRKERTVGTRDWCLHLELQTGKRIIALGLLFSC